MTTQPHDPDSRPHEPALPAAAVADALIRLGHQVRTAPPGVRRLVSGPPVAGPAIPCRHFGSVDVFLEALESAPRGGVLVIDNGGRDDEACIGDLIVAEAQAAGVAAIVLWGFHRDSAILSTLELPVWSLGSCPPGPLGARPIQGDRFATAQVGDVLVTSSDLVLADDDGVVFVASGLWPDVRATAARIVEVEQRQAAAIVAGTSLRDQLRFTAYLERRAKDPDYGLRQHLAETGGAIET